MSKAPNGPRIPAVPTSYGWEFPADAPSNERYCHAVGRFVVWFGTAEKAAFTFLTELAGVNIRVGAAILSGLRAENIIRAIRRVVQARRLISLSADIDTTLSQFAALNALRNDILHQANDLFQEEEGVVLSNYLTAHTGDRITETAIPISLIEDAINDLTWIFIRFVYFSKRLTDPPDEVQLFRQKMGIGPLQVSSWFYKPPQPIPSKEGRQRNSPARRRPPPSSPEKQ
jgi:hypothetical protein